MNGEPNRLLLELAQRYGLITVEAGNALFPDVEPNAVVKRLGRLTAAGQLERADYIRPRCYWHAHAPLGAQALPRRAAVLCYCLLGDHCLDLERWSKAAAICSAGERREAVFVDLNANPTGVARKVSRYCRENDLNGLTSITVLVPTQKKGDKIWRALKNRGLPLAVSCVAIDDLRSLLAL